MASFFWAFCLNKNSQRYVVVNRRWFIFPVFFSVFLVDIGLDINLNGFTSRFSPNYFSFSNVPLAESLFFFIWAKIDRLYEERESDNTNGMKHSFFFLSLSLSMHGSDTVFWWMCTCICERPTLLVLIVRCREPLFVQHVFFKLNNVRMCCTCLCADQRRKQCSGNICVTRMRGRKNLWIFESFAL